MRMPWSRVLLGGIRLGVVAWEGVGIRLRMDCTSGNKLWKSNPSLLPNLRGPIHCPLKA
jgi:hypothetical protein